MSKTPVYSTEEVAKHNNEDSLWIIIGNNVYDLTKFLKEHPGGKSVLLRVGGKDATQQFESLHKPEVLNNFSADLIVGTLRESQSSSVSEVSSTLKDPFGSIDIPYAEPYWYYGTFKSPYYTENHAKWRATVRNFVEKELLPNVSSWEEAQDYPRELHKIAYKYGVLGANFPAEYGGTPPNGEWDYFYDLIAIDELARSSCGGVSAAVFTTLGIALPPILRFGSKYVKDKVARDLITGEKIIALAITEPYVGSDVANIQTTARREGDFYIVNGEKKFISSGIKADYYTVAVRTGGPGMGGISLLLVDRHAVGVNARKMKTQGWLTSNTAYISFDNVKVPVENIIGKENQGFKAIMYNFNHERFMGVVASNRMARTCLEEAVKYARVRKTFGKRLIDHQVIRHKIANMAIQIETIYSMSELLAYQMNSGVSDWEIGGPMALLKVQSTKTLEFCAREASQILGGNSYIRGGQGEIIERIYREVRVNAIGGGSEEVMLDLAMRQARL